MSKIFEITAERYAELLFAEWKLEAMYWMGVDNWDWLSETEYESEEDILEWLLIW